MRKVVVSIGLIIILMICLVAIKVVKDDTISRNGGQMQSYETLDEANEASDFRMEAPDRLNRVPVTDYTANSVTTVVTYGDAGTIEKTLKLSEERTADASLTETQEAEINGMTVTFYGVEEQFYTALWTYNNFDYTISLNLEGDGVSAEEMTEYVEATI